MAQLPVCSGSGAIRAFERAGWMQVRQRGSHVTLHREGVALVLTIPIHDTIDRGLLRGLIRKAGLTVDQFTDLL
jgi:predicted RNA binding protein YcfA (HicA-like mRNA interferase family)